MSVIYQWVWFICWEDVVGQEYVKDVLCIVLEQGCIGYVYLFFGLCGVGKMIIVCFIVMIVNCIGFVLKFCGECESCFVVWVGLYFDVMEIDVVLNNLVDDVCDLCEKVGLVVMCGGKKIYIFDEVYMMSCVVFNVLFKMLEELFEYVIFILVIIELEKIILIIFLCCQYYCFCCLIFEEIVGKFVGFVMLEGVSVDFDVLNFIGCFVDGVMCDGESLFEWMLVVGMVVMCLVVEEVLGLFFGEWVCGVVLVLFVGDVGEVILGVVQFYCDGFVVCMVVEGLVVVFGVVLYVELGLGEEG